MARFAVISAAQIGTPASITTALEIPAKLQERDPDQIGSRLDVLTPRTVLGRLIGIAGFSSISRSLPGAA